jgi:hypothetical protein
MPRPPIPLSGKARYRADNARRARQKVRVLQQLVDTTKAMYGCARCRTFDRIVLEFHHLDPSVKDETVALMVRKRTPWGVIQTEIRKCIVVCSNCHKRIHHELRATDPDYERIPLLPLDHPLLKDTSLPDEGRGMIAEAMARGWPP